MIHFRAPTGRIEHIVRSTDSRPPGPLPQRPLRQRAEVLDPCGPGPHPSNRKGCTVHTTGTTVYVGGVTEAVVTQPDVDGAIVTERDDHSEGWHPWSNLPTERTAQ